MQTRTLTWLKKLASGAVMTLMLAVPTAPVLAQSAPPEVTFSYSSPTSFDPSVGETMNIYWYLAAANANVEIDVYDGKKSSGGTKVRDLAGLDDWSNVPNPATWDGKINGVAATAGTYYYYVTASNQNGTSVWEQSFNVTGNGTGGNGGNNGGNNGTAPQIGGSSSNDSGDYASPNPFDPNNETTRVYYTLTAEADVIITFRDPNTNQVVGQEFEHQNAGSRNQVWNGLNGSNNALPEKVYNYEILATNNDGSDTEAGTVEIEYDNGGGNGTNPQIGGSSSNDGDDYASPNPFDPNNETTKIYYTLNTSVDNVSVQILDGSSIVETVTGGKNTGSNTATWDGKNSSNNAFAEKVYTYKIIATNNAGSDTETGTVEVEYDNGGGNGTNPQIGGSSSNDGDDFAAPNPFDPNNETTKIYYNLNSGVDNVSVQILDGSSIIETVTGGSSNGANTATWDGKNSSNDAFAEKVYTYKIIATNNTGTDTEEGTVEVEYDNGGGNGNGPDIEDLYADPSTFDPTDNEETRVYFRLDENADVTIEILEGGNVIATVVDDAFAGSGLNYVTWDGDDNNNNVVDEGAYAIRATACEENTNNNCDTAFASVIIDYDGGTGSGNMTITNDFADPDPFDPDDENTHIFYTLSDDAEVTIQILDEDNDLIRTLLDHVNRDDGSNQTTWNGEDRYGDEVNDGDYTYRITACAQDDSNDCDTETGEVEVDNGGSNNNNDDLISNVEVNNADFDPEDNEESEVCFDVDEDNVEITVEILDGSRVIRELVDNRDYDKQNNLCFDWDGEDDDNDIVDDDVYQYRVRADKGNETEIEYAYTEVDTDGNLNGGPDFCGGFTDINDDSPFCKAVELMYYRGIFTGYADGTFRPFADINRAETAKVVLLALDYDILSDDGSNLGYWDVQARAWYMEFLRTAQREGVATGYPDRSFRPGGTINRVELLRMFLEASDINVPHCNTQPYPDTPVTTETRWYIDYACFSKAYGLMGTDTNGNFNPAQAMSRADVAMLFYNFETRGLYSGYNTTYYNGYYNNFAPNYGYTYNNNYSYNSSNSDDLLDDIEVSDRSFDPDDENTQVCFEILENNTDITIDVLDDDRDVVRELVNNVEYDRSNRRCFTWNGEDDDNDEVRDGDYEFRVEAENGSDDQIEYVDVEVESNGSNNDDLIDDIRVTTREFDPDRGERAQVCFDILEDNVDITIDILADDGDVVRELIDDLEYDESTNRCFSWDGEDDDHDVVRADDYEYRIEADKGSDNQVEYADVELTS